MDFRYFPAHADEAQTLQLQSLVFNIYTADIARKHSPEKGVCPVVVDFALGVSPVQILPGGLLHHLAFDRCALIGTSRLHGAVVDLLVSGCCCGALAGSVDRGDGAFLRLGLGHGFTDLRCGIKQKSCAG